MGRYFNPATEDAVIEAGGRRLKLASHKRLVGQLRDGEVLAMHLDRYAFEQVVNVTEEDEHHQFYEQTEDDPEPNLLGYYAIPNDAYEWVY